MKGLLKRLSPFAPDSSGVVSALFEFGGLTVIYAALSGAKRAVSKLPVEKITVG